MSELPPENRRLGFAKILALVLGGLLVVGVAVFGALQFRDPARKLTIKPTGPRGIGLPEPKTLPRPTELDPIVTIPGGQFLMGDANGFPDESPVHPVSVRDFRLDLHEVTVGAYAACVKAGGCTPPGTVAIYSEQPDWKVRLLSSYCNQLREDRLNHPVNCVDVFQAQDYCRWQGKRLPTEEEWEYAARNGSENTTYPWGNEFPDGQRMNAAGTELSERMLREFKLAWGALYPVSDGFPNTAPVQSFPNGRNRWGVYDLSGNVFEYVSDSYCSYENMGCRSDFMSARGGGWMVEMPKKSRAARRNHDVMWHRSPDVGMRCAKSME